MNMLWSASYSLWGRSHATHHWTIAEVERCQGQVGKFMLQLPRSSASVAANIDAGLKPVWAVIADKVLTYAHSVMSKPCGSWTRMAMTTNLECDPSSPYTRYLLKWKEATNHPWLLSVKNIKKAVNRAAIAGVLHDQREHSTSPFSMSPPEPSRKVTWFKPKGWVSDSCRTKILSMFRACNASLGNRGPAKDDQFYKLCPLCAEQGIQALNDEVSQDNKNIILLLKHKIFRFIYCLSVLR